MVMLNFMWILLRPLESHELVILLQKLDKCLLASLMNISGGHALESDSEVDDILMWFYFYAIANERFIATFAYVSTVFDNDKINI